MVDRLTGHVSAISLPEFDSYYSPASWYRDYVAYCCVSDDGKKLFRRRLSGRTSQTGAEKASRRNRRTRYARFGMSGARLVAAASTGNLRSRQTPEADVHHPRTRSRPGKQRRGWGRRRLRSDRSLLSPGCVGRTLLPAAFGLRLWWSWSSQAMNRSTQKSKATPTSAAADKRVRPTRASGFMAPGVTPSA